MRSPPSSRYSAGSASSCWRDPISASSSSIRRGSDSSSLCSRNPSLRAFDFEAGAGVDAGAGVAGVASPRVLPLPRVGFGRWRCQSL